MHQDFSLDLKLMADDVILEYRRQGFHVWSEEFRYPTDRTVLPGTPDRRPLQIPVQPDAFFVHLATLASVVNANGVQTYRSTVGVQIIDLDSSYFYSSMRFQEIPAQLQTGSTAEPFILGCPYIFAPGSRIGVNLRTLNTAQLGTVIVDLYGFKMFTRPFTKHIYFPDH
jgi:hypothetical protein